MSAIDDWVKEQQGKHFCKCGCGLEIIIKKEHYYLGIPNYAPRPKYNKTNRISPMRGKKRSEETRKRISEGQKGDKNNNFGRHHSESHKQNLSRIMLSKDYNGEKHHGWKGGVSFEPYCYKFNNKLKERIRDRDNRTCQNCGDIENGRKLSVHHIHYDKENCYPDLIALCTSCNVLANYNRDYWEEYYMNILETRGLLNWS